MEIKETREISAYADPAVPIVPTRTRFQNVLKEEKAEQAATPRQQLFSWVTPEGWSEAGFDPSGMRFVNLQFGPKGEGECYLTILDANGGGMEANVNRWRGQMGLPPYSAEELGKLPTKPLLNREATYVDFTGDFKGFGVTEAQKDYRLVGLILPGPKFILFVKMTGPKDLVEKNMPAFDQFTQSLSPAK
jgi:hypothetical protein